MLLKKNVAYHECNGIVSFIWQEI